MIRYKKSTLVEKAKNVIHRWRSPNFVENTKSFLNKDLPTKLFIIYGGIFSSYWKK